VWIESLFGRRRARANDGSVLVVDDDDNGAELVVRQALTAKCYGVIVASRLRDPKWCTDCVDRRWSCAAMIRRNFRLSPKALRHPAIVECGCNAIGIARTCACK